MGLFENKKKATSQSLAGSSDRGAGVQENLDVAEIKDGVVVLKDGSLKAVLAVSSINFDLKSDTEQEAIIYGYQRFLNTLDFPIQIVISSRRYDVKPYLKTLEERRKIEQNPLLKNQIADYINFIDELVHVSDIMSKKFYIVVSFFPIESQKQGLLERLSATLNPERVILEEREKFETYKNQLFQRVEEVRTSLMGTGVRVVPLNTQELIEMFYNFYNPSEFEYVSVSSVDELIIS